MEFRGIKLAIRKLVKDSNHTLINLIGLTASVSFSFLIFLYVIDQTSFDEHIPDAENVYRIAADFRISGHQDIYSNTPRPMGVTLVEEFPSILASTKIMGYNGLQNHSGYLKYNENTIQSDHFFAADSNFLKVFNIPLLKDNPRALHNPNTAIISETLARKLFREEEAVGKSITLENQSNVLITGVFRDLPNATYLPFEIIVSYTTFFSQAKSEIWWYGGHVFTYIRTTDSFDPNEVFDQWDSFFKKYMKQTFDQLNGSASIIFQPLLDLYLTEEFIWEPYPHGSITNIRIFTVIGIFLLLVAGFNYTNLSISYAFRRQAEMRTRKIIGATQSQIIQQSFLESTIISLLVGLLSISLVGTLLPLFNQFTRQSSPINLLSEPAYLLVILGLSILLTTLASIYPSFKTAAMANQKNPSGNLIIRKVFVTGQLTIAIALITCTIIVINQLSYVKNMDVGFDKENLIAVHLRDQTVRKDLDAFQNELSGIPGITNSTNIDETPKSGPNEFTYQMQNKSGDYISNPSQTLETGQNFLSTMGLELIAGRSFKTEDDEYKGVIINEFLTEKMGYQPGEVIGVRIKFGENDKINRKVIGVVKDFKLGSAQEPKQAMTIGYRERGSRYLMIRLNDLNQQKTIEEIKSLWANFGSTLPFQFTFISDEFEDLLVTENRLFELLVIGSILIIFISCLGLVGLASHTVAKRTKEIGIRKVLGARSYQLYILLQKDFLKTFIVAFIVGSVLASYVGHIWLASFSYRINIDISPFAVSALVSLSIVLLTLSFHSFQVIRANPVESLRDE